MPFLLVINQGIQENTSSIHLIFIWDPDSTFGIWSWEGSTTWSQGIKCEAKALDVTLAFRKVEPESNCYGSVSETRRTEH